MITKNKIAEKLRKILKVYWYDSDKLSVKLQNNQHMSKDVATKLENLTKTIERVKYESKTINT